MPRNFTPSSRDVVLEEVRDHGSVHTAHENGRGIVAVYDSDNDSPRLYTNLVERHGWYVSYYEHRPSGDMAIFMPIAEVP